MPRDGSDQYSVPVGTDGVPDTTIESSKYNLFAHDVETDLNTPRPVSAGGTGGASADDGLENLKAEKFKQVVTDWDSTVWRAGSFYAATTAVGTAPITGHAFAGIAYYANATDFILEAMDITDPLSPTKYMRIMAAGVWGNWMTAASVLGSSGDYIFDSTITFPPASSQIRLNSATQNSATEIFISHTNALGSDNTGTIITSIKAGNDILIQDKDETTKYKIFTALANPVMSGSDFRVTVSLKSAGTDIVSAQRVLISASAGIAISKKNYILNGGMQISQENGTALGTVNGYYPVDMFQYINIGSGIASIAQFGPSTPGNSPFRIHYGISTADPTVAAGDLAIIVTKIEGVKGADLRFGSAIAKQITVGFGVNSSVAGTFCVAIRNEANNRSYVSEYVIAPGEINTDVKRTITLPGDVTGTWPTDNTPSINISWALTVGTTRRTGTPNAWVAGDFLATANQINFNGTLGNIFELFDVGLYEGSAAPLFQLPDYAAELALCQRYYQKSVAAVDYVAAAAGVNATSAITFAVEMRTNPAMATGTTINFSNTQNPAFYATSVTGTAFQVQSLAAGRVFDYLYPIANARL